MVKGIQPHPNPSPSTERGTSTPSLRAEREPEGEVSPAKGEVKQWHTEPELWQRLKPIARQNRKESTEAEAALWQHLRNRKLLGFKFRRQHAIERFIVDFYSAEANLVIEVDGPIHQYSKEEDAIRQAFIMSHGFRLLRFTNEEVINRTDGVLKQIANLLSSTSPQPLSVDGEGHEYSLSASGEGARGRGFSREG